MKKIVIAGGTGFLGKCLSDFYIQKDYQVVIFSRQIPTRTSRIRYYQWDGDTFGAWVEALENAEALINLTGKSVDCRYNEANKAAIYSSRLNATNVLGKAISKCKNPPKVWINAASATIYRHSLDQPMDEENGETGTGFSVDVCQKWEQTFNDQIAPSTRKVILRIAIVLGYNGGALQPLKNMAKLGLGGKHGPGNQYFSWIHQRDFINIVDFAITNENITGVYNVSAPTSLPNASFMKSLRQALKVSLGVPTPVWLLKIGAVLINTETELLMKSRYVIPKKLLDQNYSFEFPEIDGALEDLVRKRRN